MMNQRLIEFVDSRTEGYLFGTNVPPQYSTLHSQLEKVLKSRGFHSFRRYRTSLLRSVRCPEDIIRFWLGHADSSITDRYSKIGSDEKLRRQWCDTVGIGFDLPGLGTE
jgi:integrase